MLISLFKDNIVFPHREFFLKYTIYLVPAKDNPWPQNKEEKSDNKTENSRIKKNRYTEDQTDSSEENHKKILYT